MGVVCTSIATSQIRVRVNKNTVAHMQDGILDRKREKKKVEIRVAIATVVRMWNAGAARSVERRTSSRTVYICHEASRDKGWCCRWVQVNLWPPDEILFPQQRLV